MFLERMEEPGAKSRRVLKSQQGVWTWFLEPCASKQESGMS